MVQRFYPAVLERGPRATFAVWFPDFPGCVAAARSQEEAIAKAQGALAQAVIERTEEDKALPAPTPFEKISLPKDCDLVSFFAVAVEPPNPSERVNIYLPKALLARIDARTQALGISRSSFFGLASSWTLDSLDSGTVSRLSSAFLRGAAAKPSKVRARRGKP
jgi:predicted RNase H-like HicB family nuclease